MRRKDREVKDYEQIIDILSRCKVLHLALISEGKPYSVPLNFGYVVEDDADTKKLSVYFHCASEGKKLTAIKENPDVCFSAESLAEADGDKENACTWTCYYESVIGFGKAKVLTDSDERAKGLDAIMLHHGFKIPAGIKKIAYNAMELARTAVVRIEVDEITGKHHLRK